MHFLYLLRKGFILELNGEKVELLVKVKDLKIMKNKANYRLLRDT